LGRIEGDILATDLPPLAIPPAYRATFASIIAFAGYPA